MNYVENNDINQKTIHVVYQGALTVVGENDKFIRATMDHDCNVSSEMHMPLGAGVQGKLSLQLGKQDVVMGTASYQGAPPPFRYLSLRYVTLRCVAFFLFTLH